MGFPGSLSRVPPDRRIARIGLLNISTVHRDALTKVPVLSSSYWIRQGVDAVAIQLHLGAEQEGPMLSAVGAAIESATDFGLPVLGIAYARGGDYTGESVDLKDMAPAHAARLMMELGASIIKVPLLGGPELQPIVEICDPVPVIVAGGDVMDLDRWLSQVSDALAAGVAGVCVGRNILGRPDWQRAISRLADAASK
jgi:DhnA family fructose-bisphosphate aldolase class Ia